MTTAARLIMTADRPALPGRSPRPLGVLHATPAGISRPLRVAGRSVDNEEAQQGLQALMGVELARAPATDTDGPGWRVRCGWRLALACRE